MEDDCYSFKLCMWSTGSGSVIMMPVLQRCSQHFPARRVVRSIGWATWALGRLPLPIVGAPADALPAVTSRSSTSPYSSLSKLSVKLNSSHRHSFCTASDDVQTCTAQCAQPRCRTSSAAFIFFWGGLFEPFSRSVLLMPLLPPIFGSSSDK
jgi:hypothetical protein